MRWIVQLFEWLDRTGHMPSTLGGQITIFATALGAVALVWHFGRKNMKRWDFLMLMLTDWAKKNNVALPKELWDEYYKQNGNIETDKQHEAKQRAAGGND